MHTPHPAWLQEILVPVRPKFVLKNLARVRVEEISPFLTETHMKSPFLRNSNFSIAVLTVHFLIIDPEMNVSFFYFQFSGGFQVVEELFHDEVHHSTGAYKLLEFARAQVSDVLSHPPRGAHIYKLEIMEKRRSDIFSDLLIQKQTQISRDISQFFPDFNFQKRSFFQNQQFGIDKIADL